MLLHASAQRGLLARRRARLRRVGWAAVSLWCWLTLCLGVSAGAEPTVRLRVRVLDAQSDTRLARARAAALEDRWAAQGVLVQPVLRAPMPLGRSLDSAAFERLEALSRWYTVEVGIQELPGWWARVVSDPDVLGPVVEPLAEVQAALPDDPVLGSQLWYLQLIGAPDAWDVVRGQDGDVVVAVVDTGTDVRHPDLVDNLWRNPGEIEGNGIDDDGNGHVDDVVGWNFTLDSNDPTGLPEQSFNRDHGTHVAGIIAATTDNATGVAGIGFNPRLMAINAADPENDRFLRYGYDGIVYAALMGADVINCSWRTVRALPGSGPVVSPAFRDFENDVCAAAEALGSLVVAAAGNDASSTVAPTPAFYPTVLAVTATRIQSRILWSASNTGPWVDLAAPGELIWSTVSTLTSQSNPYGTKTGTSMAAPVVASAAALLKVQHPDWTPLQLRQRLRGTADSLVDVDLLRGEGAGAGLVRLDRAVGSESVPGIHVGPPTLQDADGDGAVEGGEDITLAFSVTGPFSYDGPVDIEFESDDPYLVPLERQLRLPRLSPATTLEVRRGLTFYVRESAPAAHIARIDFRWRAGAASGRQSHWVELLPLQATIEGGAVRMSAASNGKLGYADPTRSLLSSGEGLRATSSRSTSMAFGALVLGNGETRVSSAVQAARPTSPYEDFRPDQDQSLELESDGGVGGDRSELVLRYSDNASADRLGAGVQQRITGWRGESRGSFVLSHWNVRARVDAIAGLHLGVLVDWSAPDASRQERVRMDPALRMQWVEPASGSGSPWAGAMVLEGPGTFRGDWIWGLAPEDPLDAQGRPAVYDLVTPERKLSDPELWALLSREVTMPEASAPGNVAGLVGMGPVDLARGESVDLVVAYSVAEDFDALRTSLLAARVSWESLREGRDGREPVSIELLQNLPNPFNPSTMVRFALPEEQWVRLTIFDLRGRRVRGLLDARVEAGFHRESWDGRDDSGRSVASGVYFVQLRSGDIVQSRRMVLVR